MEESPEKVDVLICGSGSAGLCAALWLSRFPSVKYRILERREGPLRTGQADGVQTRTVEVFDSFGIASDLLKEAYHVLEVAFWSAPAGRGTGSPDDGGSGREDEAAKDRAATQPGIRRSHYAPDKETSLSHRPHVILNQARLNKLMIDEIERCTSGGVVPIEYGCEVQSVEVNSAKAEDPDAHCVRVTAVRNGVQEVYDAKYVLGCDGAHSTVRKSLGIPMLGDSTDAVWGVMDVYPRTDFPDIRKKAVVHAGPGAGNLLIIPREGDALVRFYVELPAGTTPRSVTFDQLRARAALVLHPHRLEVAHVAWWSAYAIGQRLAGEFHRHMRVFLTGDACHTHSPKAGQGMNVSLQDGYNIGWKLGAALTGRAAGAREMLETYVAERQATAAELIAFDREFARLFSSQSKKAKKETDAGEVQGSNGAAAEEVTAELLAQRFVQAGRYTAGQAVRYAPSILTSAPTDAEAALASGVAVGMRFPSAQVVRFCDAKAVQLLEMLVATGRWYVVVFAGHIRDAAAAARLDKVAQKLERIVSKFTRPDDDLDSVIDPVLVLSGKRTDVEQAQIPSFFTPVTGPWKMKCLLKTYVDDESYNSGHGHAYRTYGVDEARGALVVVRPDQYTAKICDLEDVEGLELFFSGFLSPTSKDTS
ncbi:hypothetical protein VTK73DRAFT_7217 [Phialemonium thermophilum]|uniref:Phenol 2-monooxygenase n=1 Tax=Phialemonium thermophilum TaxID=223376 RepID=A0ABR3WFW5_9PEZI